LLLDIVILKNKISCPAYYLQEESEEAGEMEAMLELEILEISLEEEEDFLVEVMGVGEVEMEEVVGVEGVVDNVYSKSLFYVCTCLLAMHFCHKYFAFFACFLLRSND
jgi:hypothetical protein